MQNRPSPDRAPWLNLWQRLGVVCLCYVLTLPTSAQRATRPSSDGEVPKGPQEVETGRTPLIPSGVLTLTNGDRIWGTFAENQHDEHVAWRSPLFRQPLYFAARGVRSARFFSNAQSARLPQGRPQRLSDYRPGPSSRSSEPRDVDRTPTNATVDDSQEAWLRFNNGDSLRGNVVSVDRNHVRVQSVRHGTLQIPRPQVAELVGLAHERALLFDSTTSMHEWSTLVFTNHGLDPWQVVGPTVHTQEPGANVYVEHDLADRILADVRLSGRTTPAFEIAIGASKSVLDLNKAYSIETWGRRLVLHRQVGKRLAVDELMRLEKNDAPWHLHLEIILDYVAQRIAVYANGNLLGSLALSAASLPGQGLMVRNRGTDLRVDQVQIRRWSGAARVDPNPLDRVVLADQTQIDGDLISVDQASDKMHIRVGSQPSGQEAGDDSIRSLRLANVRHIQFRARNTSSQKTGTTAANQPGVRAEVTYSDGSFLTGQWHHVDRNGIWLTSKLADRPMRMGWTGMSRVRFTASQPQRPDVPARAVIESPDTRLHGKIVRDDVTKGIRWQPIFSRRPVRIIPNEDAFVRCEPGSSSYRQRSVADDGITLVNGDRLPCRIESIDEGQIHVTLPDGRSRQLDRDVWKVIRQGRREQWIYRGPKRGDRWFANVDRASGWQLANSGAWNLSAGMSVARRLKAPARLRITLDLELRESARCLIGYGADTVANGVRKTIATVADFEVEQVAEQPLDETLEVDLTRAADRLTVRGRSAYRGTSPGSFRNLVFARRQRENSVGKTLSRDASGVLRLQWTLDRSQQENVVVVDGQELLRWRSSSRLRGSVFYLDVRSVAAAELHVLRARQPDAAGSIPISNEPPLVTIHNLEVQHWFDEMSDDQRERFLSPRTGAQPGSMRHVLRAVNGDCLRGELIRMTPERVTFRSRLNPLELPRDRVADVIALRSVQVPTVRTEQTYVVHLRDGGSVRFRSVRSSGDCLEGVSKYAGSIAIDWTNIAKIEFFGDNRPDEPLSHWAVPDTTE